MMAWAPLIPAVLRRLRAAAIECRIQECGARHVDRHSVAVVQRRQGLARGEVGQAKQNEDLEEALKHDRPRITATIRYQ
jgi:hypothetical protein